MICLESITNSIHRKVNYLWVNILPLLSLTFIRYDVFYISTEVWRDFVCEQLNDSQRGMLLASVQSQQRVLRRFLILILWYPFGKGVLSHKPLGEELVLQLCREVEDVGPLHCLLAVQETNLLPLEKALPLCRLASHRNTARFRKVDTSLSICIKKMERSIRRDSRSLLTPSDILSFCIDSSSKRQYLYLVNFFPNTQ